MPAFQRAVVACVALLALLIDSGGASQTLQPKTPDEVVSHLFFGQVYPSGNIYLQPVRPRDGTTAWPPRVTFQGMRDRIGSGNWIDASFAKVVRDVYPPGEEGMDRGDALQSAHNARCGWQHRFNPVLKYAGPDYFETVFDYCERDPQLGLYRSRASITVSYPVIATAGDLTLLKPDYSAQGKLRPTTSEEQREVKVSKEAIPQDGCSTVPQFIDAAEQLATFAVQNTDDIVRVSQYVNAGCAGHQETVYVIDVVEKGTVKAKFVLSRYYGPI